MHLGEHWINSDLACSAANLLLLEVTLLASSKVLVNCLHCQGASTLRDRKFILHHLKHGLGGVGVIMCVGDIQFW